MNMQCKYYWKEMALKMRILRFSRVNQMYCLIVESWTKTFDIRKKYFVFTSHISRFCTSSWWVTDRWCNPFLYLRVSFCFAFRNFVFRNYILGPLVAYHLWNQNSLCCYYLLCYSPPGCTVFRNGNKSLLRKWHPICKEKMDSRSIHINMLKLN